MNEEYKINEKNKFDASALDSAHNLKFSFSFCSWFSFCRFGFRIGEPNGDVKRNQKVYVWDYRIFLNCLIVWVAMVAYQWILGFHPHFFQHYQVSIDQQFFFLSLFKSIFKHSPTSSFDKPMSKFVLFFISSQSFVVQAFYRILRQFIQVI